jgi:hypothetical protein
MALSVRQVLDKAARALIWSVCTICVKVAGSSGLEQWMQSCVQICRWISTGRLLKLRPPLSASVLSDMAADLFLRSFVEGRWV